MTCEAARKGEEEEERYGERNQTQVGCEYRPTCEEINVPEERQ